MLNPHHHTSEFAYSFPKFYFGEVKYIQYTCHMAHIEALSADHSHLLINSLFSLRTSDTGFLLEAFSFYAAIRSRQYYSKATREEKWGFCLVFWHFTINADGITCEFFRPELMVKKLRYYARFILVCLLLKKLKLVRDLIRVSEETESVPYDCVLRVL